MKTRIIVSSRADVCVVSHVEIGENCNFTTTRIKLCIGSDDDLCLPASCTGLERNFGHLSEIILLGLHMHPTSGTRLRRLKTVFEKRGLWNAILIHEISVFTK